MSKILRDIVEAPSVSIGEKHIDFNKERRAQDKIAELFPLVSIITDPNGSHYIPIQEITRIEEVLVGMTKESYENGYKQGYDEGLNKGLEEAKKVLADLNRVIKDAVSQRETLLEDAKKNVLELVLKISKKVTFNAIEVDPERVLEMISGVINTLIDRSKLKIKVNPQHLPIVEQNIDKFLVGNASIKEISIEPDSRVEFGGCFIETPTGDIDARIESQFEVIKSIIESDGE